MCAVGPQCVSTGTCRGLNFIPHYVITYSDPGAVACCHVAREGVQTRECKASQIQPHVEFITATDKLWRLGWRVLNCTVCKVASGWLHKFVDIVVSIAELDMDGV